MNSLVYFPSFEPHNEAWLKFSLLYLDEFRPIIPDGRRDNITDSYKIIRDETDLINPYSPDYMHGEYAGTRSAEEIDKILINPERYKVQFNNQNIEEWRNKEKWNYFIYEEKYSYVFKDFCLKNNLGEEIEGGISLSEEVGYIFMKNLANEISKETNSSIITDSIKFQHYDKFDNENQQHINETVSLAESVVNLKMPVNINELGYKEIIQFRNKHRSLIKNFQIELDKIKSKPNDISALEFLTEFDNVYSKSMSNILLTSLGIITVPLSIYSYLDNSSMTAMEELKSLAILATGASSSIIGIKNIIHDTNNKRQCVKYFAGLENLF